MTTTDIKREDMGCWQLPLPPDPSDKYAADWEPIPRYMANRVVPFGYYIDPDDERWLLPIARELQLLALAKVHVKRYSYTDVAAWLTAQSGRYITAAGLRQRIKSEQKRKNLAATKRAYAKRLSEVIAQIDDLEHRRLGAKKGPTDEAGSSGTTGSDTQSRGRGTTETCPCCGATRSV